MTVTVKPRSRHKSNKDKGSDPCTSSCGSWGIHHIPGPQFPFLYVTRMKTVWHGGWRGASKSRCKKNRQGSGGRKLRKGAEGFKNASKEDQHLREQCDRQRNEEGTSRKTLSAHPSARGTPLPGPCGACGKGAESKPHLKERKMPSGSICSPLG